MESIDHLQELCGRGQALLMQTRYVEALAVLEKAERLALEALDWDTLARLYLPLQETRRQIRQRCGEGEVDLGVMLPPGMVGREKAFAEDFVRTHRHGQYLIAGNGAESGALGFATAVRKLAQDQGLFVEAFLGVWYAIGGPTGMRVVAVAPMPEAAMPVITDASSLDDVARAIPGYCLLLPSNDLGPRTARGNTTTYGRTMAMWERLAATHLAGCLSASNSVPVQQRIEELRKVIQIDPGCEIAHQQVAKIAMQQARQAR